MFLTTKLYPINTTIKKQKTKVACKASSDEDKSSTDSNRMKNAALVTATIATLGSSMSGVANAADSAGFDLEAMYASKGQTAKVKSRFEGTETAKLVEQPAVKSAPALSAAKPRKEAPAKKVKAEKPAPKVKAAAPAVSAPKPAPTPAPAPAAPKPKAAMDDSPINWSEMMNSTTPSKPKAEKPKKEKAPKKKKAAADSSSSEGSRFLLPGTKANFSNMPAPAPKKEKAPRPVQPKPTYEFTRSGPGEAEGFQRRSAENKSNANGDNEIVTFIASVLSAAFIVKITESKDNKPKLPAAAPRAAKKSAAGGGKGGGADEAQKWIDAWKSSSGGGSGDPAQDAQKWIDAWKAKQ